MPIVITVLGNGLALFEEATRTLGSPERAGRAFARAINRTAVTVTKEAGQALSEQTGLPKSTGRKAIRQNNERATPQTLAYVVHGSGGNVSLKYFRPHETKRGVWAKPRSAPRVEIGTFMKAGWWPERIGKPGWNGQVFERIGDGHSYNVSKVNSTVRRERVGTKFRKVKSDVFIPEEMTTSLTAAAWSRGARTLQPRIEHEIRVMTKGIVK